MGVASDHTECHMTQVEDWGRCGYGGLRDMGGVGPSTTPPPPGGCIPFIECLGKTQLWVQKACLVTPEVGRK